MDWTALSLSMLAGLTGIGAVAVFLQKYMPAFSHWAMVAKDAVETLSDLSEALKKGSLSAEDMTKLQADVAAFRAALSAKT